MPAMPPGTGPGSSGSASGDPSDSVPARPADGDEARTVPADAASVPADGPLAPEADDDPLAPLSADVVTASAGRPLPPAPVEDPLPPAPVEHPLRPAPVEDPPVSAGRPPPPAPVQDPLRPAPVEDPLPVSAGRPDGRTAGSADENALAANGISVAPGAETPGQRREADAVAQPVSLPRPLPRVMAVANQKGGVGKTTTAINLGACLADLGWRTLVVDLDPQGNASTGLGIDPRGLQVSMYDVIMHDAPIDDCVEATAVRGLFVAPAALDLAGAEIELVPAFSRELKLKRALDGVLDQYDYILVDCPPSLGLLTVNGLAAATEVVVPIQCEYYALEGLGQLLRNVELVRRSLNPSLEVSTIILVMYDARTKLADQVVHEVREHFGAKVCRQIVPRTVRLSEAPSFGQPIIAFDPSSRGALAYRELAKEVSGGAATDRAPERAG